MRDLHHSLRLVQALDPAPTTADRFAAPIDRRGFEAVEHVVLIGSAGVALNGTMRFDLVLESSDDGATWQRVTQEADVHAAGIDEDGVFAVIDAVAKAGAAYSVGYVGGRRYSRIGVLAVGSHGTGTPIAAVTLLGAAQIAPAN